MKECPHCQTVKPLDEFYNDKKSRDGKRRDCKQCVNTKIKAYKATHRVALNAAARDRRHRNIERDRELKRLSRQRHPSTKAEYQRMRRRMFPEKLRAYNQVQRALRAGKITRPSICEGCHEEKRVHAHHRDYSRPLEVQWLCQQCHKLAHWFPYELCNNQAVRREH